MAVSNEDMKEVSEFLESINESMGGDQNDVFGAIAAILALPDEQFEILAPGVLESFKQTVNNPNDKVALAQVCNAAGIKAEDFNGAFNELSDALEKTGLPRNKRDFLTQMIGTLVQSVSDTEGISKRFVPIPVELCNDNAVLPQYAHISDSGMDVFALEDITIHPGETVLVPTGIKMALPPGYEIQVRPKSGLSLKSKLRISNAPGTIKVI